MTRLVLTAARDLLAITAILIGALALVATLAVALFILALQIVASMIW